MTIGKAQLKDGSDEEHEEDADDPGDRRALDEIFIRDKPTGKGPPAKGKLVHVDRQYFQDIDEKVAKQKAADAFRHRFAPRPQSKAPPAIDFGDDDDGIEDIDEFLGELKLEGKSYDACIICFPRFASTRLIVSYKVCELLRFAILTVIF